MVNFRGSGKKLTILLWLTALMSAMQACEVEVTGSDLIEQGLGCLMACTGETECVEGHCQLPCDADSDCPEECCISTYRYGYRCAPQLECKKLEEE